MPEDCTVSSSSQASVWCAVVCGEPWERTRVREVSDVEQGGRAGREREGFLEVVQGGGAAQQGRHTTQAHLLQMTHGGCSAPTKLSPHKGREWPQAPPLMRTASLSM